LTSINVSNLIHADNQYTHTVETDTVLIEPPPELFGFQITFDYLILANLGGILPTAYALTCEADSYSIQVKISSIRIVSFYDFDVGHLSGIEATNLFKVDYESGNSIDKLINTDQMDAYFPFYRINFYLQSRPTLNQYQQFEVQFIMEDGQVLRDTTAVIHFL
jgi:hypothetical protein